MKKLPPILLLSVAPAFGQITYTNVTIGNAANDGTGDTLRSAFEKVNHAIGSIVENIQGNGGAIKDVRLYGLTGDGSTDHTATLNSAIEDNLSAGDTLGFLYGTNILEGVNLTKNLNFYIAPGAAIQLKDDASSSLFEIEQDFSGRFYGGGRILGGTQGTNQIALDVAFIKTTGSTTSGEMNRIDIENLTFEKFAAGAVIDFGSRPTSWNVKDCKFLDGYQYPVSGHANTANGALLFSSVYTNSRPHIQVTGCTFDNYQKTGRLPGGVLMSNARAYNSFYRFNVSDNFFNFVGDKDASVLGNSIAPIDAYQDSLDSIISGNIITNCYFVGIKGNNAAGLSIIDNKVHTTDFTGISVVSGYRTATNGSPNWTVQGNTVWGDPTKTVGIAVSAGDVATNMANVIIAQNIVTNCLRAVALNGFLADGSVASSFGPVKITGNILHSTNNNTINILGIAGDVDIIGNEILNEGVGNGITAAQTNSTANIRIAKNNIRGASIGVRLEGVGSATFDDNFISGPTAVQLDADADGNGIGAVVWNKLNRTSGTLSITYADITAAMMDFRDGTSVSKTALALDKRWYREDGTTPVLSMNAGLGVLGIGTNGTLVSGVPLTIAEDGAGIKTLLNLRNMTAGGAGFIGMNTESISGGPAMFDDGYTSFSRRTGRGGWIQNNGNGILLEATTASSTIDLYAGSSDPSAQFDGNASAGNTRFLLYDVSAGALKRVSVGAADSGGSGFKVLRVAN